MKALKAARLHHGRGGRDKRDRHKKKAAAAGARAKSAAGSSSQPASGDVSGSRKPSSAAEHDADEEKAKEPT